jgi:S-methylmethionine-dependent homocysteine/selenocysteine methylase
MSKYRNNLPQLNGKSFLSDGGLETTLIFHLGMDLPHFASFNILNDPYGERVMRDYIESYLTIARKHNMGFILESPTWRANKDWGYLLGYNQDALTEINKKSIAQLEQIRNEFEDEDCPMVISGCIGPRGDGYKSETKMSVAQAKAYHKEQIKTFCHTAADLVTSFTMNYVNEAMGIALGAKEHRMPVVIGFTLETDGKLPSGESLQEAIETIDNATSGYPAYYMINCAHPSHFMDELDGYGSWKERIMAIRANASKKSHAELDESEHLDVGDKHELAHDYLVLRQLLPNLNVIGGCCGTDHTHIEEICHHWHAHVA